MMATYIRQNGERLVITEAQYNKQLRRIQMRMLRRAKVVPKGRFQ